MDVSDDEGELFMELPAHQLAQGVFQFGQALTRIHDLNFLNRVQVEKTLYDDLKAQIAEIVGADKLLVDFIVPGVPNAEEYAADFCIQTARQPLLICGVPSQTKARLATIIIQHLKQQHFAFRSMVVYADMSSIPRADVSRLTTAANDQIPSLGEIAALRTKITDVLVA